MDETTSQITEKSEQDVISSLNLTNKAMTEDDRRRIRKQSSLNLKRRNTVKLDFK